MYIFSQTDAIPSPDVPLMILYKKLEMAKTKIEYKAIKKQIYEEESVSLKQQCCFQF